jgi:hypothetical protein
LTHTNSSRQTKSVEMARKVKARHENDLMAYRGVTSVGVGLRQRGGKLTEEVAVVVMVVHKRPAADLKPDEVLPREVDNVGVDVQESGEITAF